MSASMHILARIQFYGATCILGVVMFTCSRPVTAQTITPSAPSGNLYGELSALDSFGGALSSAIGVSADGSVVVGFSRNASNTNRAFRWTDSGGLQDLGTLSGMSSSIAYGISGDGSIIVGQSNSSTGRAFLWTAASGLRDLGTLIGGSTSSADAISTDGTTIVGWSSRPGSTQRATQWTTTDNWASANLADLGTLPGAAVSGVSDAKAISGDGSIIVGDAINSAGRQRAFRWTGSSGMVELGTLPGVIGSGATAISRDGSVIAGWSGTTLFSNTKAFRWTASAGMVSLGTVGADANSGASGISQNGAVIVGWSGNNFGASQSRGFRWTAETGMQSVEDWLRAGGVSVAGEITRLANATNQDGSVVVGQTRGNEAFIARLSALGSGLVTITDLQASLEALLFASNTLNAGPDLIFNGLHSQPLSYRIPPGQKTAWLSGDWGQDNHGRREGSLGVREVGGAMAWEWGQLNLAGGQAWGEQSPTVASRQATEGNYAFAELLVPLRGRLWGTLSGFTYHGDTALERRYRNAGAWVASTGRPNMQTHGLRARIEWDKGWKLGKVGVSPYADFGISETKVQAYTETGGGFPARLNKSLQRNSDLRLGLSYEQPLSGDWKLLGVVEGVHRFERYGSGASGEVLGLFSFDYAKPQQDQDWLRAGIGVEYQQENLKLSVTAYRTTEGSFSNAWVSARLGIQF